MPSPAPKALVACSRSEAESIRSQSSSSVVLLSDDLPALLVLLMLSIDVSGPDKVDLLFCPMRKIDAKDGRRGDDLCVNGEGAYGEAEFEGVWICTELIDSAPILVFARRRCVAT